MDKSCFGIGIVGCGNISEHYAMTMPNFPQLKLVGFSDIDQARANALADRFQAKAYQSLAELLADPAVDIVLNLTIFSAHYEVSKQCLLAGKHVYSEKPLALKNSEAAELLELAKANGVHLGGAPAVFLGDAQETAWKFIDSGQLGNVKLVFAEVNQGRIEVWHPAPEPFYEVGPVADVGIYAITLTTALFGPIKTVQAYSQTLLPHRVTKEGRRFTLTTPDFYSVIFELANGIVFRLNANFFVDTGEKQVGYEIHGEKGSLYLSSWHNYDATVAFRKFGDKTNYQDIPLIRSPFIGPKRVEWCRGVDSFAASIRDNTPALIQGEQAAHVLEAILAVHESAATGRVIEVHSTFRKPGLRAEAANL